MKTKRNISLLIEYKIVSQNCLKAIVQGTRTFTEDSKSISFIKRLNSVKNALCERADKETFTDLMKTVKKDNVRMGKYRSNFGKTYDHK